MDVKHLCVAAIIVGIYSPFVSPKPISDREKTIETTWTVMYSNEIQKIDSKLSEFRSNWRNVALLCKISNTKQKCESFVELATKSVNSVATVFDFMKLFNASNDQDSIFEIPSINDVIKMMFYC